LKPNKLFTRHWANAQLLSVVLLLFWGGIGAAHGQAVADLSWPDKWLKDRHLQDTLFVRPFKKKISPRFLFGSKVTSFGFGRSAAAIDSRRYYPNVAAFIGVGVFYKTVGISFSYLLERQNKEQDKNLGKTQFFDLELRSYAVKFGFHGYYQDYKGFFIGKPGTVAAGSTEPLPQRADLRLQNIGAQVYSIQNWRRFSMQAAFQNTRQQIRSGGSVLYMANIQYLNITGDSSVNTNTASGFSKKNKIDVVGFERGQFFGLSPLIGYGHTFVAFKRLYFTGVFFLGPGLQRQHLDRPNGLVSNYFSPYLASSLKLAVGYNTPLFFTSAQFQLDGNRNYLHGVRLQANTSVLMLQMGYRF